MNNLHLKRGNDGLIIDCKLWADALVLAEDYGWKPPILRMNYLRNDFELSDDESKGIAGALNKLFDRAIKEPLKVYPIRPNMGELYELKEFLSQGAATARVPAWHR
ncbi:MAG: hypothetical protein NTW49_15090 [Bacteroidia bacterium]|nr:hypothetical protein [Bacteroidia bacterium]